MDVMLLDRCLEPLQVGKPFTEFLGDGSVPMRVLLPLDRRNILSDSMLKFLTGTTQLGIGSPNETCHFGEALWP
jgi:hypothetical protein